MKRNRLRFLKTFFYDLKRSMGEIVDLYEIKYTNNRASGKREISFFKHIRIRKAVVGTTRELRSFVYDLAFISANKDFTTGGFFDPSDRIIIIDKSDTKGWDFELDQVINHNNKRYDITLLQELDYFVVCRGVSIEGQNIVNITNTNSSLIFNQTASGVLI